MTDIQKDNNILDCSPGSAEADEFKRILRYESLQFHLNLHYILIISLNSTTM